MVKELLIDLIGLAGLAIMAYGLHQLAPWLSYTVTGGLLVIYSIKAK